jgi:hypothetical protein
MNGIQVGIEALTRLLSEFRKGRFAPRKIDQAASIRHRRRLSEAWDSRFPGFPPGEIPYASCRGTVLRGKRDKYLRRLIVQLLAANDRASAKQVVVNPVCVFGRHARFLAARLPQARVIAADINPAFNWLYAHTLGWFAARNYCFRRESIFDPHREVAPTAVVFFGACGALSDAAMDYAVTTGSRWLACRTCCHDNIGGNTRIVKRPTLLNLGYRIKNQLFAKKRRKATGEYFSEEYGPERYPRSAAAREVTDRKEMMAVSRHSVDSDVCRAIIDLDRFLFLVESGYEVWHKGDLFVALKHPAG